MGVTVSVRESAAHTGRELGSGLLRTARDGTAVLLMFLSHPLRGAGLSVVLTQRYCRRAAAAFGNVIVSLSDATMLLSVYNERSAV